MIDRGHIEAVIELLVSVLDVALLDPEAEDAGEAEDEEGGGDTSGDEGEPDFGPQRAGDGPACSISDPDCEHDGGEPDEGVSCACYGVHQSTSGMSEQAASDSIDAGPIRLRRPTLKLRSVLHG